MKVYIAGPYSSDPVRGTRAAVWAGETVLHYGDAPYIPHLTMFWDLMFPHPYLAWIELDMEWLRVCEGLIRLPGPSDGADAEEAEARRLGLQVWQGVAAYVNSKS